MEKAVVISSGESIDVSTSVAHEDFDGYPYKLLLAEGVAVFNENMEVLPILSDFLTHYRREHSDQSVRTYACNLVYLINYLTTHDKNHIVSKRDDCLLTVDAIDIQKYFDYCRSGGDSNNEKEKRSTHSATISNRDATYGRFFTKFLCNPPSGYKLYREDNPYESGGLARTSKDQLIKPAQFSDIEALVQVANHEREKALIQFMYDSGVRRGEVEGITQESILQLSRESRKSIIVDEYTFQISSEYVSLEIKGNKGRGRDPKFRHTVVSKETINRIQKYHSSIEFKRLKRKWGGNPPAFLNKDGNPYTARGVSKLIVKLSKRALKLGLIKKPISPHKIRHGFAAMLLNSNDLGETQLDRLLLLQQCLGHTSLKTTEAYTKIPFGVWDKFIGIDGNELKRYQLMKKLKDRTRAKKGSTK